MEKSALIAMSGGVDSSVAAALMVEDGYRCVGVTMQLYHNETIGIDRQKTCCSLDDVEDARRVAYDLGMQYHVFNFSEDFGRQVIDRFVCAYECGQTPNPCIDCNRYMKFEKLYGRAKLLGLDKVVTGHYARVKFENGRWLLKKAKNETKDQSYVLYFLSQEQLAHTAFPLGEFASKAEVRDYAARHGFVNADKPDSQDICFVPDGDYAAFIRRQTGREYPEGNFVDPEGNILGRHKGIIHYTVGQRKGLGLALKQPGYVCGKNMERDEVIVGTKEDLLTDSIRVKNLNWIAFDTPPATFECTVKTRYQAPEAPVSVSVQDGIATVKFQTPQKRAAAGQSVVFYNGDTVVGGGIATE